MILKVLEIEVGGKNRSKIEAQDGWPLGIDFWWILMGFGRQVGRENRAKIGQQSIQKGIEKMIKKRVRLGGILGGDATGGLRGGNPDPPPFTHFQKIQNPEPRTTFQSPEQ